MIYLKSERNLQKVDGVGTHKVSPSEAAQDQYLCNRLCASEKASDSEYVNLYLMCLTNVN